MKKNLKLGVVTGILVIGAFFAFSGSAQTNLSSGKNASSSGDKTTQTASAQTLFSGKRITTL